MQWWHIAIGAALTLLLVWLIPRGKSPEFANLTEGSISTTKIIAPFDFEILKSDEELNREREEARRTVLPVVIKQDSVRETYTTELMQFAVESFQLQAQLSSADITALLQDDNQPLTGKSKIFSDGQNRLFTMFGFRLSDDTWRFLIRLHNLDAHREEGLYLSFFSKSLIPLLTDIYATGVIDVEKKKLEYPANEVAVQDSSTEMVVSLDHLYIQSEALERISQLLAESNLDQHYAPGAVSASYEMLQPYVVPNTFFDAAETNRRRQLAIAKVPLARGFVKKNELIIDSNIKVTKDHLDKLHSLAIKRVELDQELGGFRALLPVMGNLMLVALILFLFGEFLSRVRRRVWGNWKLISIIALIIALLHIYQAYVPVKYELSRNLFPIAVGAMMLAILVDRMVALAGVVIIALIAGIIQGHDFIVVFNTIVVGATALMAVRAVQNRGDVMRAAYFLAGVYVLLVVAFHYVRFTPGETMWNELIIVLANAVLSPILVIGLIFIFERLFKITTDLSLIELLDLNRPLLRDLAINAPGTYHHSIMVGSIAEEAAREIGANALLTRAGAYYHDIGKLINKESFIENQPTGSENPHNRLSPSRSAEQVINHVTEGVRLAEEYGLPEEVIAFITEHHGKTRLAYFYAKAVEELGEAVNEKQFRYPGPNPQSKETGILMLADTVEAAARSIEEPTLEKIADKVNTMVDQRLHDGDLDECPLTLKEIGKIKTVFIKVLAGIHHQRIQYPENPAVNGKQESQPEAVSGEQDE